MEVHMDRLVPAHKNLDVWKRALILAEMTYVTTRQLPVEERYGLSAQMRRAAVSVLSNISEGAARRTLAEYIHFLHIARGSLSELDAQLTLAIRLQFVGSQNVLDMEVVRVGQLLNAQISALRLRSKEQKK
jgi:four helix bundle protein